MTNTVGVLDKHGTLLTGLTASEIDALFADGTIHGGMLPEDRLGARRGARTASRARTSSTAASSTRCCSKC